jgi:hypothetical protein
MWVVLHMWFAGSIVKSGAWQHLSVVSGILGVKQSRTYDMSGVISFQTARITIAVVKGHTYSAETNSEQYRLCKSTIIPEFRPMPAGVTIPPKALISIADGVRK